MGQLTVKFSGVCTHFHHNYVPGIPHRVVLPDATAAIPGFLTGPWISQMSDPKLWSEYFLMPHVATISLPPPKIEHEDRFTFETPGLIDKHGHLITPCRLEVTNATGNGVTYPDGSFMDAVPQLTTYDPGYVPSDDVVNNGRASAYFDISNGAIRADRVGNNIGVMAVIQTDDAPQLRVSAFSSSGLPVPAVNFTLPESLPEPTTLLFGNIGLVCEDGRSQYDFLLHYLTAQQRIPRALMLPPPGLTDPDKCPETIFKSLMLLAKSGYPGKYDFGTDFDTSAACSDSRYP